MNSRAWIRGLSAGTLMITGMVTSSSFSASAQESVTPAAGQAASQSAGAAIVGTPLLQPAIDLTRAQEIALEGQANAVVTEIDLNGDDGFLAYSVMLNTGLEVEVDATTGTVVKAEQADSDENNDEGEEADSDENGEDSDEGDSEESGDEED